MTTAQSSSTGADHFCGAKIEPDGTIEVCIPATTDPLRVLQDQEPPRNDARAGHGVWLHNGAFHTEHQDYAAHALGFDFVFTRRYRSSIDYENTMGLNWDHIWDIHVVPFPPPGATPYPEGWCEHYDPKHLPHPPGGGLRYYDGTGRLTEHAAVSVEICKVRWCDGDFEALVTTYAQNPGESFEIQRYALLAGDYPPAGEPVFYRVRHRGGLRYILNCHGYIVQLRSESFDRMTFHYGLPLNPRTNYYVLRRIVDTLQRAYSLDYDDHTRIKSLTDFRGRSVTYVYQGENLHEVKLVAGDAGTPRLLYGYVANARRGLLETIVNPVEASAAPARHVLKNTYRGPTGNERVEEQIYGTPPGTVPSAGGTYKLAYQSGTVQVTDRENVERTYVIDDGHVRSVTVKDEVARAAAMVPDVDLTTAFDYDVNHHRTLVQYPSGRKDTYRFKNANAVVIAGDEWDQLLGSAYAHHNDLSRDDLLESALVPTSGPSLSTTFRYEPLFNCVREARTPLGKTVYAYDNGHCATPQRNGKPVKVTYPPQRHPDGTTSAVVEERGYGPGGQLSYRKDPDGVEHTWTFHPNGLVESYSIGGELEEWFEYDDAARITTRYDSRVNLWAMEYDDRDLMRTITDPLGHVTRFACDLDDRLHTTTETIADDPSPLALTAEPQRTRVETIDYDALGNRVRVKRACTPVGPDELGELCWEWSFDAEERVIKVRSPRAVSGERADAAAEFAYNARGLRKRVITAAGGTKAATTKHGFDEDGHPAWLENPVQQIYTVEYDAVGRPSVERWPDGTEVHRDYVGPQLRREWVTGPVSTELGATPLTRVLRETLLTHDASERLIERVNLIFDPMTRTSVTAAPPSPTATIGPSAITRTWYTPGGRLWKTAVPGGGTTEMHYRFDHAGLLQWVDLHGQHKVEYEYDGPLVDTVRSTIAPAPGTRTRPAPSPLVITETRSYDELGRVFQAVDANGMTTRYAYDSLGNRRAEDNAIALKTYHVDGFSRLMRAEVDHCTTPFNTKGTIVTRHVYDANGNRTGSFDDLGRATHWTYDGDDRLLTTTQPNQPDVTLDRRLDGLVEHGDFGAGRKLDCQYDPTGRPTSLDFHDPTGHCLQRLGYDGSGQIRWAYDTNRGRPGVAAPDFRVRVFRETDSLGRLTRERTTIPEHNYDQSVGYQYDTYRHERAVIYPGLGWQVTSRYDLDGGVEDIDDDGLHLLTRVSQGPGRPLETTWATRVDFDHPSPGNRRLELIESVRYEAAGRPFSRNIFVDDLVTGTGLIAIVAPEYLYYDPRRGVVDRRVLAALRGVSSAPYRPSTLAFGYDGQLRVTSTLQRSGGDTQRFDYQWDGANLLHEIDRTDVRGGQTTVEKTTIDYPNLPDDRKRIDHLPHGRTTEWTFGAADRLDGVLERNATGLGTFNARTFTYDACNRLYLARTEHANGDYIYRAESDYLYDAFGRLVYRAQAGEIQSSERTFFSYDGNRCILELDHHQPLRRYVYDDRDQLVRVYQFTATRNPFDSIPINTNDGSPWLLFRRRMRVDELPTAWSGDGASYYLQLLPSVLEEQRFEPFEDGHIYRYDYSGGSLQISPARTSLVPIATGGRRELEPESLIYNIRRFYEPDLRGFITPDTAGNWFDALSLGNAHTFAGNNPVLAQDDGNLAWLLPILFDIAVDLLTAAAIGAVLMGAAELARQVGEMLDGKRSAWNFNWSEVGDQLLVGAGAGAAFALLPTWLAQGVGMVMLVANVAESALRWYRGEIGAWEAILPNAVMILPAMKLPKILRAADHGNPFVIEEITPEPSQLRSSSETSPAAPARVETDPVARFKKARSRMKTVATEIQTRDWIFVDPRDPDYRAKLLEAVDLPDIYNPYDADHMTAKTAAIAAGVEFVPEGWLYRPINQRTLGGFGLSGTERFQAPDVKAARLVRKAMARGWTRAAHRVLLENLDIHLQAREW